MTKRLIVAILFIALAVTAGSVAGCGGGLPGDAVAKVGEVTIAQADFNKRVEEFAAQYSVASKEEDPEGWADFEKDVLEYLVTYEMVVQKAEEYGLTVTDEEIQTELDNIVTSYYGGDVDKFNEDLTANNLTLDQLKMNYRESMMMQKVYDKVTEGVTTVPDEDIAAFYEENKDGYFTDETRVTRHILITPGTPATNPPTTTTTAPWGSTTSSSTTTTQSTTTTTDALTDADWDTALVVAREVRTKLAAGGDWTELAAQYSDDPGTAASGGELGTVSKGEMVAEFEESVFSLGLNEVSEPIKTTYGYHIIEVTAINAAKQYTLEEVKEEITSDLVTQAKQEAWLKWVTDTKDELKVVYREGWEPTTTTESTSTTVSGATTTSAAGATTTTAAGDTITTATTAKP